MSILMWDKPKKVLSKKQWEESYGFEDGPTGGYISNMSQDDKSRWKAKVTGQKLGYPQVEIRKEAGSQLLIIVNLGDGYNYKYYRAEQKSPPDKLWDFSHTGTFGICVHMSLNGPAQLTLKEMGELNLAVEEAKAHLNTLVKVPGERKFYGVWVEDGTDYADLSERINALGAKVAFERPLFGITMLTAPISIAKDIMALKGVQGMYSSDFIKSLADSIPYNAKDEKERMARGMLTGTVDV